MRGLSGRVAVVAGGAGGIGTATSLRLGEEGASVVVGDLNGAAAQEVAERIRSAGGRAVATATDVSDEAQVEELVQRALKEFGGLDLLHANAADLSAEVIGRDTDIVDIPMEVFDRTVAVNLRGHVLCARRAVPVMLERGGGALVFTSSAAAYVGEPERPAYAITKSGITALVRHIASKWGKQGIRANAVAPGLVLTPTVQEGLEPQFRERVLRMGRSSRLGAPEDIAAMVAYLGSADGEWINGQVLSVDGGALMR
jgi:NAD(P)-dependent dehydrogenase (short-subunit alcohol dehydrogenase family)